MKQGNTVIRTIQGDITKINSVEAIVYCQNMLDCLGLDVDEIVLSKLEKNEAKYPVEKARGNSTKYDQL